MIHCEISIIQPQSLKDNYTNITYSLARFGEVDYRKTQIFEIQRPSSETACTFLDRVTKSDNKIALLIQRGGCSFTIKATNTMSVTGIFDKGRS